MSMVVVVVMVMVAVFLVFELLAALHRLQSPAIYSYITTSV